MNSKIVFSLSIFLVFFCLCLGGEDSGEQQEDVTGSKGTTTTIKVVPTTQQEIITEEPEGEIIIPLSDLQINACNSADEGGTCKSKLEGMGIVSLSDCCKYLGKCC